MKFALNMFIIILIIISVSIITIGIIEKPGRKLQKIKSIVSGVKKTEKKEEPVKLEKESLQDKFAELRIINDNNIETYFPALLDSKYIIMPLDILKKSGKITVKIKGSEIPFNILGYDEIYNIIVLELTQNSVTGFTLSNNLKFKFVPGQNIKIAAIINGNLTKNNGKIDKLITDELNYLFLNSPSASIFNNKLMTSSVAIDENNSITGLNLFYENNLIIPSFKIKNILESFNKFNSRIFYWLELFIKQNEQQKLYVNGLYNINSKFHKNDVIVDINDFPVNNLYQFNNLVNELADRETGLKINIIRNNKNKILQILKNEIKSYPFYDIFKFSLIDKNYNGLPGQVFFFDIDEESVFTRFGIKKNDLLLSFFNNKVTSCGKFIYQTIYTKPEYNYPYSIRTSDGFLLNLSK